VNMLTKSFSDFGINVPSGTSGEVDTTCPQCSPHRKKKTARCLSVNLDKGTWLCWHCSWRGSLAQGEQGKSEPFAWKPKTYTKPSFTPHVAGKAGEWLKSRGIPDSVIARNRISYERVWMQQVEDHVMAIAFPYYRNGEVVNVKYRDARKNFRQVAGAERILYGMDDVDETLVWTEGEIDKLSVEAAGFVSCVSVPDGAPNPDAKEYAAKFSWMERAEETLSKVKDHYLAVDSDAPGRKLEEELARRLGREKCWRVVWPDGCKDANEVLMKHGAAVLRDCIVSATQYPVEGISDALDAADAVRTMYRSGSTKGEWTGWGGLDSLYTVRPGELTVITGVPSSGKSEWLDALVINLMHRAGWRIGVCSPENAPLERHLAKLLEKVVGKPFEAGYRQRMSEADMEAALLWLNDRMHFILERDSLTVDQILDLARVLVYRRGIQGLVIDPWNELEHLRPNAMTETEYISQALGRMRRFARMHGVHIWLVAHPTKMYRDKDGKYPVPTPYDISGSSHFRNKADNCITVWRDMGMDGVQADECTIYVQKVRFKDVGKIGSIQLRWDRATGRYWDYGVSPGPVPLPAVPQPVDDP
jgi:twinkle protein